MKSINWKDIAELVGIAAIVASLIFVGQQMRLDRTVAEQDAWLQHVDTQVSLGQLINDNAEVWTKGLAGAELTEIEQVQFNQIAFALEEKAKSQFYRSTIGIRRASAETAAKMYARWMYLHPGLRRFSDERWRGRVESGEASPFQMEVFEHLDGIDKGEIEKPRSTSRAF